MAKDTKPEKSWLWCKHRWRTAPSNRTEDSGPISKPPDHPVTIRNASSFFHNSLEKRGVDLSVFNCNSQLIGRGFETFVAQDILCDREGVTCFSSSTGGTPSSSPLVQGPSLPAHLWLLQSEDALVLLSTSCALQKADVTKSDWISAILCREPWQSLPEQGKASPMQLHGSDHRVDHWVTGQF